MLNEPATEPQIIYVERAPGFSLTNLVKAIFVGPLVGLGVFLVLLPIASFFQWCVGG